MEEGKLPGHPHGHTTIASLFDPIQGYGTCHTARWESLAPFDQDWDLIKTITRSNVWMYGNSTPEP